MIKLAHFAFIACFALGAARAADIAIQFDFSTLNTGDSPVTFSGIVTNFDAVPVDLNSCDFNIGPGFATDCSVQLLNDWPFSVPASSSSAGTPSADFLMFTVSPSVGAPLGPTSGTFTLLGGAEVGNIYDPTTQNILGEADFTVNLTVPEPAAFLLLALALPFAVRTRLTGRSSRQ